MRASLWLDGAVSGLTLAAITTALLYAPAAHATEGEPDSRSRVSLAYPVGDLLLLCSVGVALAITGWRPGRAWALIALSIALTRDRGRGLLLPGELRHLRRRIHPQHDVAGEPARDGRRRLAAAPPRGRAPRCHDGPHPRRLRADRPRPAALRLDRRPAAARGRPRRRRAARRDGARRPRLPRERRAAARQPRAGADRRPERARQPAPADARPRGRARDRARRLGRRRSSSSTSTDSSPTTTPSGTTPATRCSPAWAARSPPRSPGRERVPPRRRRVLRPARPRDGPGRPGRGARRRGAVRARRGLHGHRVLRRRPDPLRGRRAPRPRCSWPTSACTPTRTHAAPTAGGRRATCSSRCWPSASRSCAGTWPTSPSWRCGPGASSASSPRSSTSSRARRRAARHRQGRRARRHHPQARPARRRRVADHAPAHAGRRAHPGRRARPQGGRAARAPEPRALGRERLSRRARRRRDPDRRAHHRRLRRLRRDDLRARLRDRAHATRRRSPSCAAAPARQFDPTVVDAFCAANPVQPARVALAPA